MRLIAIAVADDTLSDAADAGDGGIRAVVAQSFERQFSL
jgi:hypothetical protein